MNDFLQRPILKLLKMQRDHYAWLNRLEEVGIEFNREAVLCDCELLDVALDLMGVPPNFMPATNHPEAFCRDWAHSLFFEWQSGGREYISRILKDMERINRSPKGKEIDLGMPEEPLAPPSPAV